MTKIPPYLSASIQKVTPKSLFHYRRLDLIIKYLFARNIWEKRNNKNIESLYARHIFMRTGGKEPINEFGNTRKDTLEEYIESVSHLLKSISHSGFDSSHAVPVSSSGLLYNGAHRIACCQVLDQDVYARIAGDEGSTFDFEWFNSNGFTLDDKLRILKGFIEIHPERSAIMLVYQPVREHLGQIKVLISKKLDIVGEVVLSFEDQYIAFINLLLEIYAYSNHSYSKKANHDTIVAKAELLRSWPLTVTILLITNQDKSKKSEIHEVLSNVKKDIRKFMDHIISEDVFSTVHTSSSPAECRHMADILLSPNNLKYLKMRMQCGATGSFLDLCREAKEILPLHFIEQKDICVVGSGGLGVFGLENEIKDIDFILTSNVRAKFGSDAMKFSTRVDMARQGYYTKIEEKGNKLTDDIIINDHDLHFMFNGLKFLNLELIKQRKSFDGSEKDLRHVRMIELQEKLTGYYDHQKYIKFAIDTEHKRRANKLILLDKLQKQMKSVRNDLNSVTKNQTQLRDFFECLSNKLLEYIINNSADGEGSQYSNQIQQCPDSITSERVKLNKIHEELAKIKKELDKMKNKENKKNEIIKKRLAYRLFCALVNRHLGENNKKKLKEDPVQFFADAKHPVLRFGGWILNR